MMMKRIVVICFLISLIIPIDAQTNLWIQLYDRNTGGLNETVYALKQDDRGLIWITTYGGLYSYDGQRFVHHPDSTVKPPMAGYHWRPNTAFENKLAELAQKENWLRNGKERILCSMEDRDGNLWMGFTNGLRLCRKQEYPFHISDFDEEVLCLFQSSNGEIWMTTREGSVCLLDRWLKPTVWLTRTGEWSSTKTNSRYVVMSITETPDGSLWLAARHEGLLRLKKRDTDMMRGFYIQQIKDEGDTDGGLHALNNVYSTCLDNNNRLWTASLNTGVGIIMDTEPKIPADVINLNALQKRVNGQKLPERIRCFLPLFSDEWLVASDNGLFYMKPSTWKNKETGVFKQLLTNKADTSKNYSAQCLLCDHDGYIYVGTSGDGLIILNKAPEAGKASEVRFLSKENGVLSSNVVYALAQDKKHGVWGFCDKGLFRITSDKVNKPFHHLYASSYGEEYSAVWPAMSIGNALLLKDGRIIKGTRKGLLWFQADSLGQRPSRHNIFIEARYNSADRDTAFVAGDTIMLPKGLKDLTLYCSVLDYNRLSNVVYAYRIADKDSAWTYTTNPVIDLRDIPSGYSTLEIRATNGDGVWSGNEKVITLHVKSDDNWALSLVIILMAVIAVMFYLLAKKHSKKDDADSTPNVLEPILDNLPTKEAVDELFRATVRKNIVENIGDAEYGPERLAKDMGMSKNMLTSKIKSIYGILPVELMNRVRVQAATELLTQTELTISEIAYRVGFNDPKYFSRVYKKMTDISPTEARSKSSI